MVILEVYTIKQTEMKEKVKKRVPQKNEKTPRNQVPRQKSHETNKYLGSLPCKILWTIINTNKIVGWLGFMAFKGYLPPNPFLCK